MCYSEIYWSTSPSRWFLDLDHQPQRSKRPLKWPQNGMIWDDMGWCCRPNISETVLSAFDGQTGCLELLSIYQIYQFLRPRFWQLLTHIPIVFPSVLSVFKLVCQDIVFVGSFWVIQISRYHNTLKKESPSFYIYIIYIHLLVEYLWDMGYHPKHWTQHGEKGYPLPRLTTGRFIANLINKLGPSFFALLFISIIINHYITLYITIYHYISPYITLYHSIYISLYIYITLYISRYILLIHEPFSK